ncbi:MAG: hypothetical protein QOD06_60 [Candidatus Binatota bacterium]|jgi:hypothetical protein|nr:hypothetical protein [Candidatus Binatota bacterium]
MRPLLRIALTVLLLAGARCASAADLSPEETLKQYLSGVQDQEFDKVYDLVSAGMKHDKSKEVWAKEQQYIFQLSEAKIFDFDVYPSKIEGEVAKVPNILSSQDKFLNQLGVEEHELYILVKEDGKWKVDRQEAVVENADIDKWFPKKAHEDSPAKIETKPPDAP